jgi:hypothetical protein
MDDTFTMQPRLSVRAGVAAWDTSTVVFKLMASSRSKASAVRLSRGP